MGYDIARFKGEVDEELICPICSGVLEDPLQTPICEHALCKACINEWLFKKISYPIDRELIAPYELKPAPRILRNPLSRLLIMCDNASSGCTAVVKLEHLEIHLQGCEHNPNRPVQCEQDCGPLVPKNEFEHQNGFVSEINRMTKLSIIGATRLEMNKILLKINEVHRDVAVLHSHMEKILETKTWSDSLQRARIKHWRAMISNPDSVLQAVVRRALTESGCPSHLTVQLMENVHERRWPSGFKANRRDCENYISKRIPGTQAVVVLAIDNQHLNDGMVLFPGFVMIFAHGID